MLRKKNFVSYFRNFVFGVEDGLVSTVGLLSGIAIATIPKETILLTGVVLIFVEAFSMAAGSFLSESSAEDYEHISDPWGLRSLYGSVIMFFSYLLSGFVPLAPYLVWPVEKALPASIVFSVIALFGLGIAGAKISGKSMLQSGLRMALIGGLAIGVGALAGNLIQLV